MTDEKALELIHSLHRRTLQGKVAWVAGRTQKSFRMEFGAFSLEIQEIPDQDYSDAPDFAVIIFDSSGREVETISNVTLRPLKDRLMDNGLNPYAVLQETYKVARRKALGFDQTLDMIIDELNKA
jgi:hypothetical protein